MMYFAAILIIIITTAAFMLFASCEDNTKNIEFLKNYGWEVNSKAIESVNIIIPDPFDLVYENYNKMQKEANLDLYPYRGMNGIRYTYTVLNYPKDVGEEVRANVICIDGTPVAGDIMTVSLHGFMHSLKFPVQQKTDS